MSESRVRISGPILAAAIAVGVALAAAASGGPSESSSASPLAAGAGAIGAATTNSPGVVAPAADATSVPGEAMAPGAIPSSVTVVHDPGPPSDVAVARGDVSVADDGHSHDTGTGAGTATGTGGGSSSAAAAPGEIVNPDHLAEEQPDQPLSRSTRDALAAELVAAREAALKYPTVADAVAAGFVQAGEFAPGAGAHYVLIGDRPAAFDPADPDTYIYDGISPDSRLVGLMWTSLGDGGAPEGFSGPNDHWHRHANVCVIFQGDEITVPFPADSDITREMCDEVDGRFMETTTWMVHAWVVPSWDSPKGVFSHDNPNVRCADNTLETNEAGFCEGS